MLSKLQNPPQNRAAGSGFLFAALDRSEGEEPWPSNMKNPEDSKRASKASASEELNRNVEDSCAGKSWMEGFIQSASRKQR